jgi:hypothetical protein
MISDRAALDRDLAKVGEWIILRRVTGTSNPVPFDVRLKALVRGYRPEQLLSGIQAIDSLVIISPTELFNSQWPGGQVAASPPFNPAALIPKKGDRAIIQGRMRTVETAGAIYVGDEIVRIEMRVLG